MDFLQAAAIALISGGLVTFVEFLIRRSDAKKDKNSEVLKAIKDLVKSLKTRKPPAGMSGAVQYVLFLPSVESKIGCKGFGDVEILTAEDVCGDMR